MSFFEFTKIYSKYELNKTMTEGEIFKILLKTNTSNNNEKLNINFRTENVNDFAKNVTDLIYESLQQRSSSSNIKRGSLLVKFLKYMNSNIIYYDETF